MGSTLLSDRTMSSNERDLDSVSMGRGSNIKDSYRVLIVGCGQLGSRHLQAVASLPMVAEIEVVDPRLEARQLGRQRLEELPAPGHSSEIRWHSSVGQASKHGDLCIIATQAKERCAALREVAESLGYSSFLLEKIVAQSIKEMEDSVALAASLELKVWVNCQRRASPFYRRVKAQLDPGDPVIFNSVGGNLFLATNGVHDVDLFAFYDGCPFVIGGTSVVDSTLHHSKRGNGVYDLTGTLRGSTEKGSSLTISYSQCDTSWNHLSISTGRYRCIIDHFQQWSFESVSEVFSDLIRAVMDSHANMLDASGLELLDHDFHYRPVSHRQHWLRQVFS